MGLLGSTTTGFSEEKVNDCISTVDSQSKNVMSTITESFNDVLDTLGECWGTQDGKTWVTDTFVPYLQNVGTSVAETLQKIGNVIKSTGEQQAADTNNAVSINTPTLQELGDLINNMQDVLNNGFVGIYDDLKSKVASSHDSMVSDVDSALEKLKSAVKGKTDDAFIETGKADKVSSELETYIEEIKSQISQVFTKLNASIDENTAKADSYAHEIQQAGLRGSDTGSSSSGGFSATTGTTSELN